MDAQAATTTKAKDPRHVITPKMRLAYAYLFRPRIQKPDQNGQVKEPTYDCVLIAEPGTDINPMRAAAYAAAREKWGSNLPKNIQSPFRSNSDRDGQEGFTPGGIFITVRSTTRPGMVDQGMNPILNNEQLYSGCWVRASIRAFAYDWESKKKGVSFGLLNLQKVSDGDRLDSRRSADQDFEPLPGAETAFGPGGKGPLDDDIPF